MLQTDDLFLGAFGLVRGGELQAVEVRGTNGRRVAVFTIAGPGLDDVQRELIRDNYSCRSASITFAGLSRPDGLW